jgi:hypothetical protein
VTARWVLASTLFACAVPVEQLRTRAAYDFECPESQLVITTIDESTKGVSGCGRSATYIYRDTWIQNGAR